MRSSYSPFYFLNELDCSGWLDQPIWAPLPDAERIWFICRWRALHPWLYAYADGHVEWANEFLQWRWEGWLSHLCCLGGAVLGKSRTAPPFV